MQFHSRVARGCIFEEFDQSSVQCRNPLYTTDTHQLFFFVLVINSKRASIGIQISISCVGLQRPGFPSFILFSFKSTLFSCVRYWWRCVSSQDCGVRTVPNRNGDSDAKDKRWCANEFVDQRKRRRRSRWATESSLFFFSRTPYSPRKGEKIIRKTPHQHHKRPLAFWW